MNHLCRLYWYPVFHFIRRSGYKQHEAQDLTQAFFAQFLEKNWLKRVDPGKGRFRSFLLMILKRFLASEWKRSNAQKRAGNLNWLSLSMQAAESRYSIEQADTTTPEQSFEKQWAITILETVIQSLRSQYLADHNESLFEALKPCLMGSRESQPYAKIAAEFGMSESAIKVSVHRLRQKFRERLRAEIAQTVTSPDEVEEELKHLIRVLAKG
ncbi:sigma-70 family RNA polymerase sigma factor [bacterium]|nr:sigma-70 family RNA polymerase sigma factor [bacterium]